MIRFHRSTLFLIFLAALAGHATANVPTPATVPVVTDPAIASPSESTQNREPSAPASPAAQALREKLSALPSDGNAQEIKERAVLVDFYDARASAPIWLTQKGLTPEAIAVISEIKKADEWGLEAKDFALPVLAAHADDEPDFTPEEIAKAELTLSLAILKYARYARGGRIIDPTILLNSNLDRKPQLLDAEAILEDITRAQEPDAYLRGIHPQHPQFEKLRQAYLKTRSKTTKMKLRANMEHWRWMPDDMGELHILANVPEYIVRFVKNGEVIHKERIVVGEVGKQTTIYTRPIKSIVFKPTWRVPESIKVRELWPNLRRGGSMFRTYGLQLETKDGQRLDYRRINWHEADIRDYEVVQPPGRKSVMGKVKFTFPSQHTIFMHDTPDKWMFNRSRRTLSHGCLRLRNPMRMAELILREDKGWDKARSNEEARNGPLSNVIKLERKIPIHLVYFTAWVDDNGKLHTFSDIYGHEKRIRQALAGQWDQINVGRDHLAPVQPIEVKPSSRFRAARPRARKKQPTVSDLVNSALGGSF
jgi:murein L,D-transpeptidase YcbB/YkuD